MVCATRMLLVNLVGKTPASRLVALLGGVSLAVVSLVGLLVWTGYREAIRGAEITTRNYGAILEARLDATLRVADSNLLQIGRSIPLDALSQAAVPRYAEKWDADFDLRLLKFPELSGMRVFDAAGNLLYTNDTRTTVRANIGDRPHFVRLRETPGEELGFSPVLLGRTTGEKQVVIMRPLRDAAGSFRGIVSASIDFNYFIDLFGSMEIGEGGIIAVYRRDEFTQVLRWPPNTDATNRPLPADSPTRKALPPGISMATLELKSAADGVTRIYSYHALINYPFFISVGMSEDAVLAAWRLRSLQVGAAVLLLAALLAFLMFRLRRADAELLCLNAGLERRVKERTSDLERINRELEAFAYTISHDLRTPLRGIAGYARILEEDYAAKLDGPGRSMLQRVQVTARRMGELIEDVLNLSRVSRAELRLETVDLAALARLTIDQLRAAEPRRSVTFELPAVLNVRGDRALLAVVMANLVGNAWKFTGKHAHARIEIGVTAAAGGPTYFVRDDGVGFDMQYAANLFKPFQRMHDEREFPGNGIGLATVQRLVERHGGRVWADAVAGKGACFYFTLPNQDKP